MLAIAMTDVTESTTNAPITAARKVKAVGTGAKVSVVIARKDTGAMRGSDTEKIRVNATVVADMVAEAETAATSNFRVWQMPRDSLLNWRRRKVFETTDSIAINGLSCRTMVV